MPKYKTLMPIRTKGTLPPLFCVHGQPVKVAQRIRKDRPVYGLSHVYHADFTDEKPESIVELARQYLAEIRMVQEHGPYHFCGFSAGGMISFEMARQLLEVGEKVGSLLLVEPTVARPPRSWSNKVSGTVTGADNFLAGLWRAAKRAPASLKARTWLFLRKAVVRAMFTLGISLPESLRWIGYLESLGPAMRKYDYQPIECSATLLYQAMPDDFQVSAQEFWDQFLLSGADVRFFPEARRHADFMLEPSFSKTVALIDQQDF